MNNTITLHGVFMDIFGLGVLLTGESGIGKSEIALSLLSRGHRLVADDSIEFVLNEKQQPVGSSPGLLQNFLEVRGLGVLNIKAMFGDAAIKKNVPLKLVTHIVDISDIKIKHTERLYGMHSKLNILGSDIARVIIPLGPGRNLSVLLETAVRNHRLRATGYDASLDFVQRQRRHMQQEMDNDN